MRPADETTIALYSQRSDQAIMRLTTAFALGGACFAIAGDFLWAILGCGAAMGTDSALWVPLCFLTIPPIHDLCRQVVGLQRRLELLEQRSSAGTMHE